MTVPPLCAECCRCTAGSAGLKRKVRFILLEDVNQGEQQAEDVGWKLSSRLGRLAGDPNPEGHGCSCSDRLFRVGTGGGTTM